MAETIKEIELHFTRRLTQHEHTCPVCGTAFQGAKIAVYCSTKCAKKAAWDRNGAKYNANRKRGVDQA